VNLSQLPQAAAAYTRGRLADLLAPAAAPVRAFDPTDPSRILILDADTRLVIHPPAPPPAATGRDDAPQPQPGTVTGGGAQYRRLAVAHGDAQCECGKAVRHFDVILEVARHDWRCQECTTVIRHLHDPTAPLWP
jgi:hypothetical protein